MNQTDQGSGFGQLTLGGEFDLKIFEDRNRSERFITKNVSFAHEKDKN